MIKLEGVVVCVNYSDFLAHTLPSIYTQFDKLVVVTDLKDVDTKELCSAYGVECVQTDCFYGSKDPFNKGKGINAGLERLDKDGWVIQLDSDIYFPPCTRSILNVRHLDHEKIYGVDRLMCPSYDSWVNYLRKPNPLHSKTVFVNLNAFPVGTRLSEFHNPKGGYEPIGFFQLWHPQGSGVFDYPQCHGAADKTDVLHCKRWTRDKRELMADVVVIHLASGRGWGLNWNGRKSPKFGPLLPPQIDQAPDFYPHSY
jgi:glycosyltransferase involved in cell wall biosynthesis